MALLMTLPTPTPVPTPLAIPLEQVDEIASTSDELKRRADQGAPEAALLARRQTAGHGRHGRAWRGVDGNLHLSVLLRPKAAVTPGHWSLLAGVALAETVLAAYPAAELRLKWPNDLLLGPGPRPGGRVGKLAGILLEAGFDASPGGAPWLVAGFGVNLAAAPADLGRPAADLAALAMPAPEFAALLLRSLDQWRRRYERAGFEPVRAAWLARGPVPGQAIAADVGGRRIEGAFRGIRQDGALLLAAPSGEVAVSSGEIDGPRPA